MLLSLHQRPTHSVPQTNALAARHARVARQHQQLRSRGGRGEGGPRAGDAPAAGDNLKTLNLYLRSERRQGSTTLVVGSFELQRYSRRASVLSEHRPALLLVLQSKLPRLTLPTPIVIRVHVQKNLLYVSYIYVHDPRQLVSALKDPDDQRVVPGVINGKDIGFAPDGVQRTDDLRFVMLLRSHHLQRDVVVRQRRQA